MTLTVQVTCEERRWASGGRNGTGQDRPNAENHGASHKLQKARGHVDRQQLHVPSMCKTKVYGLQHCSPKTQTGNFLSHPPRSHVPSKNQEPWRKTHSTHSIKSTNSLFPSKQHSSAKNVSACYSYSLHKPAFPSLGERRLLVAAAQS